MPIQNKPLHIVSFSGGKDSSLMVILMLEQGMQVDDIIFADTGVEFPQIYEYIDRIEDYIERKITRLKPKKSWHDVFFQKRKKGDHAGEIYAFPLIKGCKMNSYLKMEPLNRYYAQIGNNYINYVGIAANEPNRYKRLKVNQRAPLYEWGIDEKEVINLLKMRGLHNPYYDVFDRQGCYMCPQMGIGGARRLRKHYPELWERLLWYGDQAEMLSKEKRFAEWLPGWTVRELEKRFAKEDSQLRFDFELVQEVHG
jgi:3'-phosphoadenosine 5'-phosphosulfate sulfotransferase (PAPS reductase)/FAD synthetase